MSSAFPFRNASSKEVFAVSLGDRDTPADTATLPTGNALDQASAPDLDPCAGWEIGAYEVIRRLNPESVRRLIAMRLLDEDSVRLVDMRLLDASAAEASSMNAYAKEVGKLRHKHLASVYPCEVADEGVFWVSERVPGATLAETLVACRASSKSLPLGFTLSSVYEALLGLHEVHALMPHGLISPHAISVGFEGGLKLLDVGLFRAVSRRKSWAEAFEQTKPYLSPEQHLNGRLPEIRSDLYSLGVVLYECLTGETVPEGSSLRPPSSSNLMIGKALDAVVMRLLSRDRLTRYGTAQEAATELKRAGSSFMWRPEARAQFLGELFETRAGLEAALFDHASNRRRERAEAAAAAAERARLEAEERARLAQQEAERAEEIELEPSNELPPPQDEVGASAPAGAGVAIDTSASPSAPQERSPSLPKVAPTRHRRFGGGQLVAAAVGVVLGLGGTLAASAQLRQSLTSGMKPMVQAAAVRAVLDDKAPSADVSPGAAEAERPPSTLVAASPVVAEMSSEVEGFVSRSTGTPSAEPPVAKKSKRKKSDDAPVPPWLSGGSKRRR